MLLPCEVPYVGISKIHTVEPPEVGCAGSIGWIRHPTLG